MALEEQLILEVFEHPEIYDQSHKYYKDNGRKDNIWIGIGAKLSMKGNFTLLSL